MNRFFLLLCLQLSACATMHQAIRTDMERAIEYNSKTGEVDDFKFK